MLGPEEQLELAKDAFKKLVAAYQALANLYDEAGQELSDFLNTAPELDSWRKTLSGSVDDVALKLLDLDIDKIFDDFHAEQRGGI